MFDRAVQMGSPLAPSSIKPTKEGACIYPLPLYKPTLVKRAPIFAPLHSLKPTKEEKGDSIFLVIFPIDTEGQNQEKAR